MTHARPEYSIILAILGVLLAVGVPALKRGQYVVGGLCMLLAVGVLAWVLVAIRRDRG